MKGVDGAEALNKYANIIAEVSAGNEARGGLPEVKIEPPLKERDRPLYGEKGGRKR